MLTAAFLLFAIAVCLLWIVSRARRSTGIPAGRLIYVDTSRWRPLQEPLYAANLRLTGKPDYLVKQGRQVIPVEVKTTRLTVNPYDAHIYQLAAYCLLVESVFGLRPPYGILHYPDRTYKIPFTSGLESALRTILDDMRRETNQNPPNRSHESYGRCMRCGYKTICDQRLLESL